MRKLCALLIFACSALHLTGPWQVVAQAAVLPQGELTQVAQQVQPAAPGQTGTAAPATGSPAANNPTQAPLVQTAKAPRPIFTDLPADHWAAPSVQRLVELRIISGDEKGRFRPDDLISRAELAKLVVLSKGMWTQERCKGLWNDVAPGAWHCSYIEMMWRLALSQPATGNNWRPNDPVDREELFSTFVRAKGLVGSATFIRQDYALRHLSFGDKHEISGWALPYVVLAVHSRMTDGYPDGTFKPRKYTTRAEVAQLIARVMLPDLLRDKPSITVEGRNLRYVKSLDLMATAYGAGEPWLSDKVYLGLLVRNGMVAVDPNVIPLGSLLYVEGYGFAIAADTGGDIKGPRIDLYFAEDPDAVIAFGVQTRRVYLLD